MTLDDPHAQRLVQALRRADDQHRRIEDALSQLSRDIAQLINTRLPGDAQVTPHYINTTNPAAGQDEGQLSIEINRIWGKAMSRVNVTTRAQRWIARLDDGDEDDIANAIYVPLDTPEGLEIVAEQLFSSLVSVLEGQVPEAKPTDEKPTETGPT